MEEILKYVQNQLVQAPFRLRSYTQDEQGNKYPQRNIYVKVDKYFRDFLYNPEARDRWIIIPGLRGVGKTTILAQLFLNHQQEVGMGEKLGTQVRSTMKKVGSATYGVVIFRNSLTLLEDANVVKVPLDYFLLM